MEEEGVVKALLGNVSYLYLWKILNFLTIIFMAKFLPIDQFGIAFLTLTIIYFFTTFFGIRVKKLSEAKSIKKYCNTLIFLYPLIGAFIIVLLGLFKFIFPGLPFMLASLIVLLISIKSTPDIFYRSRGYEPKLYRTYAFSQIIASIAIVTMYYFNLGYKAVLFGYILFYLISTIILWKDFPFKIKPKLDNKIVSDLSDDWKSHLINKSMVNMLTNGIMIFIALYYSLIDFSNLYLAYFIGYFLYENVTLFITRLLSLKFVNMSYDLFKLNVVRLMEYLSFIIVPFGVTLMMLAYEFSRYVLNWVMFSNIFALLVLTGMIRGVFETTRVIFLSERKEEIITKIGLVEFFILLVLTIILSHFFGLYGIALALLISAIISSLFYILVTERLTKLNVLAVSKDYFYVLFAGIITALLMGLLKEWFPIKSIFSFMSSYVFGWILYLALIFMFNKELYKRFIRFAFELMEE